MQAVQPEPLQGGINGVVWRDFSPGGGTPGEVEPQELGIPGVTVELLDARRRHGRERLDRGRTAPSSSPRSRPGDYRVAIGAETFAQPFVGISWLGEKLITPVDHVRLHLDLGRASRWS